MISIRNVHEANDSKFYNWYIAYPLFLLFGLLVFYLISSNATTPYIDEIFHYPQCLQYINGHFFHWDKKITTPPGIYLLGALYSHVISLFHFLGFKPHSLNVLRSVNLMGACVVYPLVLKPLFDLDPLQFWPTNMMMFPLLSIYYFLFYTDVWSTILIVWCLSLAVTLPFGLLKSSWLAALIGIVSVLFRQTNIVWIGFALCVLIDRKCQQSHEYTGFNIVPFFVKQLFKYWLVVIPFAIDFTVFGLFLLYNGGITLGDKDNHTVGLHLMQFFYCLCFIAILSFPTWISVKNIWIYLKNSYFSLIGAFCTCLFMSSINQCIDNFTIVHPFLLADNRHYTFYIWRKVIDVPFSKFYLLPAYHLATYVFFHSLFKNIYIEPLPKPTPLAQLSSKSTNPSKIKMFKKLTKKKRELGSSRIINTQLQLSPISIAALVFAISVTIIPSPLFEPRYYILPYTFWRLFIAPSSSTIFPGEPAFEILSRRLSVEFCWYSFVNFALVAVFVNYVFEWDDIPGVLQRIIW